jgi:hypothetical protein
MGFVWLCVGDRWAFLEGGAGNKVAAQCGLARVARPRDARCVAGPPLPRCLAHLCRQLEALGPMRDVPVLRRTQKAGHKWGLAGARCATQTRAALVLPCPARAGCSCLPLLPPPSNRALFYHRPPLTCLRRREPLQRQREAWTPGPCPTGALQLAGWLPPARQPTRPHGPISQAAPAPTWQKQQRMEQPLKNTVPDPSQPWMQASSP